MVTKRLLDMRIGGRPFVWVVGMFASALGFYAPALGNHFEGQFTALPVFQLVPEQGLMRTIVADRVVSRQITDCSTSEFFCLKGPELELLWDRRCRAQRAVGDEFSSEGITARIVGVFSRRVHHSGIFAQDLVVMVDGQSDLAYFVTSKGQVHGILADTTGHERLGSFFKNHKAFHVSDIDRAELDGVVYSPIISDHRLGVCE